MCDVGCHPGRQVLQKYWKLVIAGNFCPGNVPESDVPRALEDPQPAFTSPNAEAQEPAACLWPWAGPSSGALVRGEALVGEPGACPLR